MIKSIRRVSLIEKGQVEILKRHGDSPLAFRKADGINVYEYLSKHDGKGDILILRKLGGIGDILMCTPALKQIKTDFPLATLHFGIDMESTHGNIYFELVKNLPFIDKVINHRHADQNKYNVVVDLSSVCIKYEHSGLPVLNRIEIFSRACGIPKLLEKCSLYQVEENERNYAKKILQPFRKENKKIVALHTASMEGKRTWPIEKYIEIVKQAEKENLNIKFIIFDWNKKGKDWNKYSNCFNASNTTVRQMTALIEQVDLFIGPDSGPMHLAGAVKTPSIVIFGSIPPEARINHYLTHEGFRLDNLACIGCWYKPCPYDNKCMKELPSDRIYNRMKQRLGV